MSHGEDVPTAIGRADAALFQAKREGRDCVIMHDIFGSVVPAPPSAIVDFDASHRLRQEGLKIVDKLS